MKKTFICFLMIVVYFLTPLLAAFPISVIYDAHHNFQSIEFGYHLDGSHPSHTHQHHHDSGAPHNHTHEHSMVITPVFLENTPSFVIGFMDFAGLALMGGFGLFLFKKTNLFSLFRPPRLGSV